MVRVHTHSLDLREGKFLFGLIRLLSIVSMMVCISSLCIDSCSSPQQISINSHGASTVYYSSTTIHCTALFIWSSNLRHGFTFSRVEYEPALIGSHLAYVRVELVRTVSWDDLLLHLLSGWSLIRRYTCLVLKQPLMIFYRSSLDKSFI